MDCSRDSANMRALKLIATADSSCSPLFKLVVKLAGQMERVLEKSEVCSEIQADELQNRFKEHFNDYMVDKEGNVAPYFMFSERLAHDFLILLIEKCRAQRNSLPRCCRQGECHGDNCRFRKIVARLRNAANFYCRTEDRISSQGVPRDGLSIAYNKCCPVCEPEKMFTENDNYAFFSDCKHVFCVNCIKSWHFENQRAIRKM